MNTKPCTKETLSAVLLREDVEGKEEEMEKMNKEAKEEESGKRELDGERERVETSIEGICANRCQA